MNVKSLYPIIVSENPQNTIAFYKNLGFEIKHDATTLKGTHVYVLANGDLEIEVMEPLKAGPKEISKGLYGFRMNVSDIDKAFEELKANGATIIVPPFDTGAGKNMIIQDDQGINITIVQHIKK